MWASSQCLCAHVTLSDGQKFSDEQENTSEKPINFIVRLCSVTVCHSKAAARTSQTTALMMNKKGSGG